MSPARVDYFRLEEDASIENEAGLKYRGTRWRCDVPVRFRLASWIMGFGLLAVVLLVFGAMASRPAIGDWPASSRTLRPRVAIFQHFNLHDHRIRKLQFLSRSQHERYARFWGYPYYISTEQFVPEVNTTVRQRQMNKVYGLLQVVLGELAKGESGAEWIHITDADVLIVDPSVPLHVLLPDDDSRPGIAPFIVGSEDGNGYNSGNLIYRCGLELAAYLAHTVAISDTITKEYDQAMAQQADGKEPKGIETPPSDQRALCLALERNESFASRFFHYPQGWLNSYDLPSNDQTQIQLHTHLVAGRKYRDEYDKYEEVEALGWRWIQQRSGSDMEKRVEQIKAIAREHWRNAKIGLPHCIWV